MALLTVFVVVLLVVILVSMATVVSRSVLFEEVPTFMDAGRG